MKLFLWVRIGANFGADWAEDVCSLERMGFLPAGTLSVEFMLFAEYCQLVLAVVEVVVTKARETKENTFLTWQEKRRGFLNRTHKTQEEVRHGAPGDVQVRVGPRESFFDCELRFAHEGVFIGCALFSALLSTHKNTVKVIQVGGPNRNRNVAVMCNQLKHAASTTSSCARKIAPLHRAMKGR